MKSLERAVERLYRRNLHTVKLDLAPVRELLDQLKRPQDSFLAVHVAGTNGKGSVCAMLASAIQSAGLRVGLYTSPHLRKFNERVVVNGAAIADEELVDLMAVVEAGVAAAMAAKGMRDVTFFEFTTALAFEHFRRCGVQLAVIETGMGGRLDATNVLDPLVSVVTSIAMDHMEHLGNTPAAIAAEKAGIIKPGRPVVVGQLSPEGLRVIRDAAAGARAPLFVAHETATVSRTKYSCAGQRIKIETPDAQYGPLTLPLLGEHQLGNCAVVATVLDRLREDFQLPISSDAASKGLEATRWPARYQIVASDPPTIVDGAHNPEAARALHATLIELGEGRPVALIAGFLNNKAPRNFLAEFGGLVRVSWLVPIHTERAMSLNDMTVAARAAGLNPTPATLAQAIREATDWAGANNGIVCITGSFYLAAEALDLLGK